MDPFRQCAYAMVAFDAAFAAVATAGLIIAFSSDPPLALLIGANVALALCLGFGLRAWLLTEANVAGTEPWCVLDDAERPQGEGARRAARDILQMALLRFARAAAMVAILLAGSSLLLSLGIQGTADVIAAPGVHGFGGDAVR